VDSGYTGRLQPPLNNSWLMSGNFAARRPAKWEPRAWRRQGERLGVISPVKRPVNRWYINHKKAYQVMRHLPAKPDKKHAAFENTA